MNVFWYIMLVAVIWLAAAALTQLAVHYLLIVKKWIAKKL